MAFSFGGLLPEIPRPMGCSGEPQGPVIQKPLRGLENVNKKFWMAISDPQRKLSFKDFA